MGALVLHAARVVQHFVAVVHNAKGSTAPVHPNTWPSLSTAASASVGEQEEYHIQAPAMKFKLFGGAEHLRTAVSVNILGNLLAREGDDKAAHARRLARR